MRDILLNIHAWIKETNKTYLLLVSLLTAITIFLNYSFGIGKWLTNLPVPFSRFTGLYLLFLFCFGTAYTLYSLINKKNIFHQRGFTFLIFIAPAIFAFKMTINVSYQFNADSYWDLYVNKIINYPIIFIVLFIILFFIWKNQYRNQESFFGLVVNKINWKPYFIMILLMIPLIVFAASLPDFLQTYPKIKIILPYPKEVENRWFYTGLYELSYGLDFLTVELFFRGFLVLAFVKYAGKDSILPMAIFYCAIHFGKPLAECISSYFGGIFLGIVVYHTRTILGGLLVHISIAWLMEIGGYLGNLK